MHMHLAHIASASDDHALQSFYTKNTLLCPCYLLLVWNVCFIFDCEIGWVQGPDLGPLQGAGQQGQNPFQGSRGRSPRKLSTFSILKPWLWPFFAWLLYLYTLYCNSQRNFIYFYLQALKRGKVWECPSPTVGWFLNFWSQIKWSGACSNMILNIIYN